MIAKISRFSIFIKILSIFTTCSIQASNAPKKQPNVTFTSNRKVTSNMMDFVDTLLGSDNAKKPLIEKQNDEQPKTLTKAPAPITTASINAYDSYDQFVELDAPIKPKPATPLDIIGSFYPKPTLPKQIATEYAWSDNISSLKSDIVYLKSLIENGSYELAYSSSKSDPNIVGRNSAGLADICTKIANNQKFHRQAHTEQLQQHRRETTDLANIALLLLFSINQHLHPKKIDAAVLEDQFFKIKEERKANDIHLFLTIKECHKRDDYLKDIQEQLNEAHLTGDKSIPISPRKSVDDFTCNLLVL